MQFMPLTLEPGRDIELSEVKEVNGLDRGDILIARMDQNLLRGSTDLWACNLLILSPFRSQLRYFFMASHLPQESLH